MSPEQSVVFCVGIGVLVLFWQPLRLLYVRLLGKTTTATLKIHRVTLKRAERTRISNPYGHWRTLEASAVYKVGKLRYEARALNQHRALRYRHRQIVTIRYLRWRPERFVVLKPVTGSDA